MKSLLAFIKFLRTTKIEWLLTIAALGGFLVGLPIVLAWGWGSPESGVSMIAPAYVVDLFWRLARVPLVFLMTWGAFKIAFPTLEDHADSDDLSPGGHTFKEDWKLMSPAARNTLTVAAILAILASITLLIVFP